MSKILSLFKDFAKRKEIIKYSFLVGGTVRDILTNKKIHDYDITINEDVINIIKIFADEISASFILLDKDYGIVRVAKEGEFIDFCKMKGGSIEADLSTRDLTINAMAINLSEYENFLNITPSETKSDLSENLIIDPSGGLKDLNCKIIRMVSEDNLAQDPLRLLRAYRFASSLDFSMDINTHHAICKLSPYISRVAVERIAEELRHILSVKFSYKTIRDMQKAGLLVSIFPEIHDINPEILHYNIRSYTYAEHIINNLSLYFSGYDEHIEKYFLENYRIICLKLAILFSPEQMAETIARRLNMSKKEVRFIHMIAELHEKLLMHKNVDKAKKIGFLRLFGDDLYPLLIFTIAKEFICCPNGNPTVLFCKEMLEIYHHEIMPKKKLLPILTGDDLISELNLSPSPLFKELLDKTEALFLEGRIINRQEALCAVRELLSPE